METLLGNIVIVTTKDGRRFFGRLVGVDANKTLLLEKALEEVTTLSPILPHLMTFSSYTAGGQDDEMTKEFLNLDHISDLTRATQVKTQFMQNKVKYNAMVIPGSHIVKIEKQKNPVPKPVLHKKPVETVPTEANPESTEQMAEKPTPTEETATSKPAQEEDAPEGPKTQKSGGGKSRKR